MDIFPLDHYGDKSFSLLRKHQRIGLMRSFAVTDPTTGSNAFIKLIKRMVCPFVKNKDVYELARKLDSIAKQINAENTQARYVLDVLDGSKPTQAYPIDSFEPIRMKFEDRTYSIPSGYEDILAIQYGDWRTPPVENARLVHVMEAYRL